jgi:hypothetical protein
VEVNVDGMSDHTFWAAVLSAGDDPLLFGVEAVGIRSSTYLVEDSFSDESWS